MSVWVQERMNRKNAGHESQLFSPVSSRASPDLTFYCVSICFCCTCRNCNIQCFYMHVHGSYSKSIYLQCTYILFWWNWLSRLYNWLGGKSLPNIFFCFIIYTMQEWITYYNKSDCWLERQSTFLIKINDYT